MEKINLPIELYLVEKSKLYPSNFMPENVSLGMCINFKFNEDIATFALYPEKGHISFYVTMIERVSDSPLTGNALRLWLRREVPLEIFDGYID